MKILESTEIKRVSKPPRESIENRSKSYSDLARSPIKYDQQEFFLSAWGSTKYSQFPQNKNKNQPWVNVGQRIYSVAAGQQHSLIINSYQQQSGKLEIFAVGNNNYGQLGIQGKTAQKPTIIPQLKESRIFLAACGSYHSCVITKKGQLYTFGLNLKGQLGLGHNQLIKKPTIVHNVSMRNPEIKRKNTNGPQKNLFFYQKNNHPTQSVSNQNILYPEEYIVKIGCGSLHTVIVTNRDRIFATGFGQTFALGNGQKQSYSSFQQINLKVGKIDKLQCGLSHTGIIANGKCFLWGMLGQKIIYQIPTQIQLGIQSMCKSVQQIIDISLGDCNSVILSAKGQIYMLGQFIRENQETYLLTTPKKQLTFPNNIIQVFSGKNYFYAVSDNRTVYGWGSNKYGQLTGRIKNMSTFISFPGQIRFPFTNSQPFKIVCGSFHTFLLSRKQINIQSNKYEQNDKQNREQKKQDVERLRSQTETLRYKNYQLEKKNQKMKNQLSRKIQTNNIRIQTENALPLERSRSSSQVKKASKFQISGIETTQHLFRHRTFNNSLEINFNQLQFQQQINRGGYGVIHKGKWRQTTVAIKVFKIDSKNETVIRDFLSECNAMEALRHPNIVLFLGACTTPPNLAIVLQYCSRGALWYYLQNHQNSISWQQRKKYALDTAKGMHYLHSCNPPIIHRDLKSLNLLIDDSNNIKLADFGWTKGLSNYMTGKIGTYQWMAPQVISGQQYTQKADVFSFGIILWQIISREAPYRSIIFLIDINPVQVSVQVLNRDLRPSMPKNKKVPFQFENLTKRCWDRDPNKRPSFKQIIKQLISFKF